MALKPWQLTNKEFANEIKALKTACESAKIPTTKRQASKWRNKKGLAYKKVNKLI